MAMAGAAEGLDEPWSFTLSFYCQRSLSAGKAGRKPPGWRAQRGRNGVLANRGGIFCEKVFC